jgi:transcriptional regulator with XRE-family HTH domain
MDISERFSENLTFYREEAQMTQSKLAGMAGLSISEIEKAEGGSCLPRLEVVARLAESLDVTVGHLLDGIFWEPNGDAPGRFNISRLQ